MSGPSSLTSVLSLLVVRPRNVYHPSKFLPLKSDTHPSESALDAGCPPNREVLTRLAAATTQIRIVEVTRSDARRIGNYCHYTAAYGHLCECHSKRYAFCGVA